MSDSLTLRVLDQIRINGFEVELDSAGNTVRVFESGDRQATEQAFRVDDRPDLDGLKALATPFCTTPQVHSLFRSALRRAS